MQRDLQKNFVKTIESLPQHLLEKFIGDDLSINLWVITDIALKNWDLSVIGIAQGFFEVIDYRYSTERFIVAISVHPWSAHLISLGF